MDGIQAQGSLSSLLLRDDTVVRSFPGLTQKVASYPFGELIWNEMQPGAMLPQHSHPERQFGFALAGQGRFELMVGEGAVRYDIGSDQAYGLGANVPHGAVQPGSDPVYTLDVKVRLKADLVEGRMENRQEELTWYKPVITREEWGSRYDYQTPFGECTYAIIYPGMSMVLDGIQSACTYLMRFEGWERCSIGQVDAELRLSAKERKLHAVILRLVNEEESRKGVEPSVNQR